MRRRAFPLLLLLLAGCSSGPAVPAPAASPSGDQVALTDGMRVTGTGWIVAVPDRPIRFCGNPVDAYPPEPVPAPAYCDIGVDVVGVDLTMLDRARTKDGATEGRATLTGTFTGGVLTVEQQDPPSHDEPPVRPAQPCPEPAAGWPDGNLTPEGAKAFHAYGGEHPEKIIFVKPAAADRDQPDRGRRRAGRGRAG